MLIAVALVSSLVLVDRASVTLPTRELRVGDVATGGGAIARVVIARLPSDRSIVLSRRAIAALVRRAVPGVAVVGGERPGSIALRAVAKPKPTRALKLPEPSAVQAGDRLTLMVRSGPVTIERPVTALQPGRDGRRLFVRDDAGHVSSISFVGERAK